MCFTSACSTLLLKSGSLLLLDENEIFLVNLIASSFYLWMVPLQFSLTSFIAMCAEETP